MTKDDEGRAAAPRAPVVALVPAPPSAPGADPSSPASVSAPSPPPPPQRRKRGAGWREEHERRLATSSRSVGEPLARPQPSRAVAYYGTTLRYLPITRPTSPLAPGEPHAVLDLWTETTFGHSADPAVCSARADALNTRWHWQPDPQTPGGWIVTLHRPDKTGGGGVRPHASEDGGAR